MSWNYFLIGLVNLLIAVVLAFGFGFLLYYQATSYQENVSYALSKDFFLYDQFAWYLILIVFLAMITNLLSTGIMLSSVFSSQTPTTMLSFSLTSLLWIILYLTVSYAFLLPVIIPVPILMLVLIFILSKQIGRLWLLFLLYVLTGLIVLLGILSAI